MVVLFASRRRWLRVQVYKDYTAVVTDCSRGIMEINLAKGEEGASYMILLQR
jgi:hypothetical protein